MFFAITKETAEWVLSKSDLIAALVDVITSDDCIRALRDGDMIEGPLRLSGSKDGRVLACWNSDYLSGTGEEHWGFVKIDEPLGLLTEADVARKVFQTELHAISLRLSGLRFDASFIHRVYQNGAHTIRADRGDQARWLNLGYVESVIAVESGQISSILFVGPAHDFDQLANRAADEAPSLKTLTAIANGLILPNERRPLLDRNISRQVHLALELAEPAQEAGVDDTEVSTTAVDSVAAYSTAGWTLEDWARHPEQLSPEQRYLFEKDPLLHHPVRIVGPAGSGKSLIMQLLAAKRLAASQAAPEKARILYVVHNGAMELNVRERFQVLGVATTDDAEAAHGLVVTTLSKYATAYLKLDSDSIIDIDAYETKRFQVAQVCDAIREVMQRDVAMRVPPKDLEETDIFRQLYVSNSLLPLFARLIVAEISTAIKGHGLIDDRRRYVYSARSLSRLHNIMGTRDRDFVYSIFEAYHRAVFHDAGLLDPDDVAISLLGQLDTPIWRLRRKQQGFDYVFVDETQLFNENERRVFSLLTKGTRALAPIALALDEAQEFFGQTSAGFGALGIVGIEDERLPSNHRSTAEIVKLAFFIIEKTTDLFGPGFPEFSTTHTTVASDHGNAAYPRIEYCTKGARNIGKFVAKRISELRTHNVHRIAVICHADAYWDVLKEELTTKLSADKENFHILLQRGELLAPMGPICVLSRPPYVGGQEFEAVIAVGLEQGLVPPMVTNNPALESAVYQQALREMYLSVSRAQLQVIIVLNVGSTPTPVIQQAMDAGLILAPGDEA